MTVVQVEQAVEADDFERRDRITLAVSERQRRGISIVGGLQDFVGGPDGPLSGKVIGSRVLRDARLGRCRSEGDDREPDEAYRTSSLRRRLDRSFRSGFVGRLGSGFGSALGPRIRARNGRVGVRGGGRETCRLALGEPLLEGLEEQDRTRNGGIERPDLAAHRDPEERIAAPPD